MNRVFSIVWSRAHDAWLVVGEHAARRGKYTGIGQESIEADPADAYQTTMTFSRSMLAATLLAALLASTPALGQALPTGGQVVAGSGSIGAAAGGKLTIEQASQRMAIDWQQFNIGAGNTVQFNQPGRDAVALNRVLGPDGSQIMGQLQANGRVFLVNPNGVLFGRHAQVDVGGLVASTLDIGNADFMAGSYRFQGTGSPGSVVNQGRISAADGGAVALLGGQVLNQGVIQARMGTVALAAGNAVTLDFAGDGLLNVQVDQAAKNALAENGQLIQADGGQVLMTASASDALLQTVVNNTGVIEARTLENRAGRIVLLGDFAGGTVKVDGKLDASAPNGGDGGFIDTSGAYVRVADRVKVTTLAPSGRTGSWLIDPTDFTIREGTGEVSGSSIGAQTLSDQLGSTDISINTIAEGSEAGDIHVEADVSWAANTSLTLSAHRNINLNANITATGDGAGLGLDAGGDVSIAGNVAITGNQGHLIALASGQISVTRDVQIEGDDATISLIGGYIATGENSSISINGDGGALAMAACGESGCAEIDPDEVIPPLLDESSTFVPAEGLVSIEGEVSLTGDSGVIAMIGGDVSIDSKVSIDGDDGAIAIVACQEFGCGDILLNDDVSITGDRGGIFMFANGGIWSTGDISVDGSAGYIDLLAGSMTLDGDVSIHGELATLAMMAEDSIQTAGKISITGDTGTIDISAGTLDVAGEVSILGDQGEIFLSAGNLHVKDAVTVTGDEGLIYLATCSCDPSSGDIVIDGDVSVHGEGDIDIVSDRAIALNAGVSADYVYMEALRDIIGTSKAVIRASALWATSFEGSISLHQGVHQVDSIVDAWAQNGFSFVNGRQLEVDEVVVGGDGNVFIRTVAGDLILIPYYDPTVEAPPAVGVAGKGDIDLVSAAAFSNERGAAAIHANDGNWRIWAQDPAHTDLGGLSYDFKQYNAHYGSSTVLGQGNGLLYTLAPVLDVGLSGTVAKTYDGSDLATLADSNYVLKGGVLAGDRVVFSRPGQGRYGDRNAGTGKTVTVDGVQVLEAYETASGAMVYGYRIGPASGDIGRIDRRAITVAANDQSKYFGQADPALTWRIAEGSLVFGDQLRGALSRMAGERPGAYAITQGSLAASNNYVLDFVDGRLVVLPATIDDYLGDLAPAYHAALVSAQSLQQGPMAFDQYSVDDAETGQGLHAVDTPLPYQVEDDGLRMPEGI